MYWLKELGILLVALVFGWTLLDIRRRTIIIQNKQARLSLTYYRVFAELHTLHEEMFLYNKENPNSSDIFEKSKRRKLAALKFRIENGPSISDIYSGIEFPDIDDDKAFWDADLARELHLDPEGSTFKTDGDN